MLLAGLNSTHEMREFAALCRSLVRTDLDGVGALLLIAYCLESYADIRESDAIDAETYAAVMPEVFSGISDCLKLIEQRNLVELGAYLDSFARIAVIARIL